MLKNKLKATMAVAMTTMFLLSPISAKAESSNLTNFGAPEGFDWAAEREREKAVFERFNKEHADKIYKKADLLALFEKLSKEDAENKKEAEIQENSETQIDKQIPEGFDWEAEKARQKAVFEKFNKEHADQIYKKSEINVPNGYFPGSIKKGQPLVTMDSSTCEEIPFIGHAGIVYSEYNTIEANPFRTDGVHYGDPDDWWCKKTLYILSSKDTSNMSDAANYSNKQIGKRYNWSFWDHETTDSFYCSQLVWRSYLDGLGIDLCPGALNVIYPSDILDSSRLNLDYAFD